MTTVTTITRKEIAGLISVSVNMVRRKEKKWGLDKCKLEISDRPIEYHRARAMVILERLSLINTQD